MRIVKLYELPRDQGIRIKAETYEGDKKIGDFIIFHHIDGMYSYCTEESTGKVCHLSASVELVRKEGNDYYEFAPKE